MTFDKNVFGYPTDPQLRKLYRRLCEIAGKIGGVPPLDEHDILAEEYEATLKELYSLGWNDYVDLECGIDPMPEIYYEKVKELDDEG